MAGIDSGMNIGLHYPSGRGYIAFTYALWLCGACVTPIPMELADEEKQQIAHHIEMSAVISTLECGPFAAFAQGATIVLCKNSFGSTILQESNRQRATLIYAAPAHYELMTRDQSGQALPTSLRLAIVTTAYLRPEIAKRFHQRFGLALNETYGIIVLGHFGSVQALAGFIRQKRAVSEDN